MSIILCLDKPGEWAAYDIGRDFSIFPLDQRSYQVPDDTLPIRWRSREYGIGKRVPKEDDASCVSFLGNGEIRRCLEMDGDIGFGGPEL
jgi:hypothetical protein